MMTTLLIRSAQARAFAQDERGSPAVEFALMAPVLILLVFGIVQFGFAFFTYNDMFNGARGGARRRAVGAVPSVAVEQARDAMALDRAYAIAPVVGGADVTMTVTLKISQAMVISVLPLPEAIAEKQLTASVTMRKE